MKVKQLINRPYPKKNLKISVLMKSKQRKQRLIILMQQILKRIKRPLLLTLLLKQKQSKMQIQSSELTHPKRSNQSLRKLMKMLRLQLLQKQKNQKLINHLLLKRMKKTSVLMRKRLLKLR
jgi:hypothetical protein